MEFKFLPLLECQPICQMDDRYHTLPKYLQVDFQLLPCMYDILTPEWFAHLKRSAVYFMEVREREILSYRNRTTSVSKKSHRIGSETMRLGVLTDTANGCLTEHSRLLINQSNALSVFKDQIMKHYAPIAERRLHELGCQVAGDDKFTRLRTNITNPVLKVTFTVDYEHLSCPAPILAYLERVAASVPIDLSEYKRFLAELENQDTGFANPVDFASGRIGCDCRDRKSRIVEVRSVLLQKLWTHSFGLEPRALAA